MNCFSSWGMGKVLSIFSRTPVQVKFPELRTRDGDSETRIQNVDKGIPAYYGRIALKLIFCTLSPE